MSLNQLAQDKGTVDELRAYCMAHLDMVGLDRIYSSGPTAGLFDAKQVLENMFNELEGMYAKENPKERLNEAR